MKNRIMIDLETMGNGPTAAIVSIGAVSFNSTGATDDGLYIPVNLQSCVDAGLSIDVDTVQWWMQQSAEARSALDDSRSIPLKDALTKLDFYTTSWPSEIEIWGNGADYDNVILASAYRACKMETPWKFWQNRCYRTLKNLAPQIKMERHGTHHNALDDAISQAEHAASIIKHLGIDE